MALNPTHHPIIYVRGFAMRDNEIEDTINTPYMGFNLGATRIRQKPDRSFVHYIFESPLIRLMKEYGYKDVYHHGAMIAGEIPQKSIIIYRYYERDDGTGQRPSIPKAAEGLSQLIEQVRDQVCGDDKAARKAFKVYLVAHSMGGLICRCLLQNDRVGSQTAKACIDKVYTYGTPHNGIEMNGINVPRIMGLWDINNFNRSEMAKYLDLKPINGRVSHLNGKFPEDRFFCLIGTNHRDYNLARLAVGPMSDGLVKIENAYIDGAPRVHTHLSHSGHYGMVNSEEGYQNLVRFLFGNVKMHGKLVAQNIPLPPSVESARKAGKAVRGSYYFEVTVMPRQSDAPPVPLSDRRVETSSAIFRTYDEMFHPDRVKLHYPRHPTLCTLFLDTRKIAVGRTLVFTIDLAVRSTDFIVDGDWFFNKRIPEENVFREKIAIKATRAENHWQFRYVMSDDNWGESRGRPCGKDALGSFVPLKNAKGFHARLYMTFEPWE